MESFRDHPDVVEIQQICNFFDGNRLEVFDARRNQRIKKLVEQTSAMENFIQYYQLMNSKKAVQAKYLNCEKNKKVAVSVLAFSLIILSFS